MKKTFIFILSCILIVYGCENKNDKKQSQRNNEVEKIINQLVIENDIPGLNFSIILKGGHQKNFSAGYSNPEIKTLLHADDVLFSGSIGKTYAVAVLMQLVDEGKLSLQDKVIDYFPESEWMERLPNINEITVEMCLQHTTGLPRYVFKSAVWDTLAANPDKVWSYKDRFYFVFDDKPLHEAGKGWAYSDTNYLLIGMLIERITGEYYYDVVNERLLLPNNLNATYASIRRDMPNLASGYSRLPEMFKMPNQVVTDGKYVFNPQMEWTGGGFASTTSDLAKWAKLYYTGHLFSDSLAVKIITPNKNSLLQQDKDNYGMGSFIFDTRFGKAYNHTGFVPGFNSIFAFFPEQDIAVAMQINCDYATESMTFIGYLEQILPIFITH